MVSRYVVTQSKNTTLSNCSPATAELNDIHLNRISYNILFNGKISMNIEKEMIDDLG